MNKHVESRLDDFLPEKMEIVDIKKIKSNPNNPRIIKDDKFNKLVASIKSFPEMLNLRPIVVNENMIVLGGNMRLKACIESGLKTVPIIIASHLNDDKQKEFIIKDNVGFGEWDWDLLNEDWNIEDLTSWGLDVEEFDASQEDTDQDEDSFSQSDIETNIVLLDLIEIGPHRILCGDSTDAGHIDKLMQGELAHLAHNDPPYGMKKEKGGVLNDNLVSSELLSFNSSWIPLQFTHLLPHASWYCWGIDEPLMDIYSNILKPYLSQKTATFRNLITWNKTNCKGRNSSIMRSYARQDEKCLFIMMGDIKNKKVFFDNTHDSMCNVWDIVCHCRDGSEGDHPTPKPSQLCERVIKSSCPKKGLVIDFFLGTGSTMIAAHKLNRKCYGMELSPKWCQIIINRMKIFDPNIEVKINGVKI